VAGVLEPTKLQDVVLVVKDGVDVGVSGPPADFDLGDLRAAWVARRCCRAAVLAAFGLAMALSCRTAASRVTRWPRPATAAG
jgi:hypothetical protein